MAKTLKVSLRPSAQKPPYPKTSWLLTDFKFLRKRIYLAVHAPTLFSVSATDIKKPSQILPSLKENLDEWISHYGINVSSNEIFNLDSKEFFKNSDKRLLSTVNQIVMELQYHLHWNSDIFGNSDLSEAQMKLHKGLFTLTDYVHPIDLFREMFGEQPEKKFEKPILKLYKPGG